MREGVRVPEPPVHLGGLERGLFAGGTVGLSLQVAKAIRLFPEIAIYTPLAGHGVALPGDVVRVSPDVAPGTPVILQAGLGVAFGGAGREP